MLEAEVSQNATKLELNSKLKAQSVAKAWLRFIFLDQAWIKKSSY